MNLKRSKAFTLTELLIVVIVIGILAAVVLPKFTRIMETRKTTEAEDMMFAIRTEQERRCSLGQLYTTDFATLGNIVSSSETAHYSFALQSEGMLASSKGNFAYNLRMPSYSDGRICCDDTVPGNECSSLNKDYMTCTALLARQDYQPDAACAADAPGPENPPDPHECTGNPPGQMGTCDVNGVMCGTRERIAICDHATGEWTFEGAIWGRCEPTNCDSGCSGERPDADTASCVFADVGISRPSQGMEMCGSKTRAYECNSDTGNWDPLNWDTSACQSYHERETETVPCSEIDSSYNEGTAVRNIFHSCVNGTVTTTPGDWNTANCCTVSYGWESIQVVMSPASCGNADLQSLATNMPSCDAAHENMTLCVPDREPPCSWDNNHYDPGWDCDFTVYKCIRHACQ